MNPSSAFSRICAIVGIIIVSTAAAQAAFAAEPTSQIDEQRELFRGVFPAVERGHWEAVDDLTALDRQLLEQYVLWPDLRATWLRANIKSVSAAQIDAFVQQYGTLKPTRELRYRHALNLVRQNDLSGYLRIYQQFYQGQGIEKLDCLALQAEIKAGRHQRVEHQAIELWMVGKSQVGECDAVFDYLNERNLLGIVEYQKRYQLAIDERNFTLAGWLAKKIDPSHVEQTERWQQAKSNSESFLKQRWNKSDDETVRAQLVYAAHQLTYRDPEIAHELWAKKSKKHKFSESQKLLTAQHIALWAARDGLADAYRQLLKLPPAAASEEVLRWRARTSLRESRWKRLLTDIAAMPEAERTTEEWRYWNAIALHESGQALQAIAGLESLRQERSYYGFLAADKLAKQYSLGQSTLLAEESKLAALESRPELIRARELYYVGQYGRGRSEWDAAIEYLSDDDKMQAAILAHRWGWHSRAIAAVASVGKYDDLAIRYPLPFQETFEEFASQASIPSTWAYGIARSESLFMRDVKSHAGAIGLMQIMPATGRDVAREIKLPYYGVSTLTDPQSNIQLGTTYLGQMAERYGGNQVLATAAYNAGPHRVDRWLPEAGTIDARVWIENIPFNETRKYVKRVMAAQAIFHWRMTGTIRRLSDQLPLVQAAPESLQVASR